MLHDDRSRNDLLQPQVWRHNVEIPNLPSKLIRISHKNADTRHDYLGTIFEQTLPYPPLGRLLFIESLHRHRWIYFSTVVGTRLNQNKLPRAGISVSRFSDSYFWLFTFKVAVENLRCLGAREVTKKRWIGVICRRLESSKGFKFFRSYFSQSNHCKVLLSSCSKMFNNRVCSRCAGFGSLTQ